MHLNDICIQTIGPQKCKHPKRVHFIFQLCLNLRALDDEFLLELTLKNKRKKAFVPVFSLWHHHFIWRHHLLLISANITI